MQQDGKYHSLKLELSREGAPGELEPGEMLEALSFYRNGGKITLGCYAAFGEMEEYGLDFNGQWDDNGIEVLIFPSTRTHTYRFGGRLLDQYMHGGNRCPDLVWSRPIYLRFAAG